MNLALTTINISQSGGRNMQNLVSRDKIKQGRTKKNRKMAWERNKTFWPKLFTVWF